MAKPGRPTQEKRKRELGKKERQQEKQAERAIRKEQQKDRRTNLPAGQDPDLIGICPGPQPPADE
jgi:hypothetical protein